MPSEAASRRITRGVTAGALLAAGYYFVFGGAYTLSDIRVLEEDAAGRMQDVTSMKIDLASIRALGDSLEDDPWVIERVARERYSFIRPGEILFRFIGPLPEAGSPADGG